MSEKCFCHLHGYAVKDATARQNIESLNTKTDTLTNDVNNLKLKVDGLTVGITISPQYDEQTESLNIVVEGSIEK